MSSNLPVKDGEDAPTLSYSSLRMYGECPKAWWHRYIAKTPTTVTGKMQLGTALDRAIRNLHDQVIDGKSPDSDAAKHVGKHEWAAEHDIDATDIAELDIDATIDACVEAYAERVLPGMEPIATQVKVKRDLLVDGETVTMIGYVDLVEQLDGKPVVTDVKTTTTGRSSSKYTDDAVIVDPQLRIYQALLEEPKPEGRGWRVADLGLKRGVKIRNVHVYEEDADRINEITIKAITEQAGLINHSCGADDFPPLAVGTWKCSARYCDFYNHCEYGIGMQSSSSRVLREET